VLLLVNVWIGRLADRAGDWRGTIVAGAAVSAVAGLGLALVGGFWSLLLVWTLTNASYAAVVPVTDAAAMRLSKRAGFDFSAIRAWGTVGYLVFLLVTGVLIGWFGGGVFLVLFCGLGVVRALAALALPAFRAPSGGAPRPRASLRPVLRPWFVLPLLGWSIVFSTHLVLNAFQSLLWKEQGLPEALIGALIALGALSEAAMFFLFRHVGRLAPARWLILASCTVTVLRWTAFGFSPGVALLIPLQMLHGITYAMGFLACVTFITNWTSEEVAAEAQSVFVVMQQAACVVALAGFGWLAGEWGARAYFASAAVAAAGGALVFVSLRLKQPAGHAGQAAPAA
jgi:PPP family 3-phenylpropionic acid transporter